MARWKLLQPHYLNTPGTTWEYVENDRLTGKPIRRSFNVPTFLHPESPGDWNYREGNDEGYIVVSNRQDNAFPKDYLFASDPTPDMEPLDDEAREISAKFKGKWDHPIKGLPTQRGMGYSQSLLDGLQNKLADAQTKAADAQAEGMKEILGTMAAMMKQNQDLLAALAKDRIPESARRA